MSLRKHGAFMVMIFLLEVGRSIIVYKRGVTRRNMMAKIPGSVNLKVHGSNMCWLIQMSVSAVCHPISTQEVQIVFRTAEKK